MASMRDLEYCRVGHLAVRRLEDDQRYCAACGGAPWKEGEVVIDVRRICEGHHEPGGRLSHARCETLREHKARHLREAGLRW